MTFSIYIDNQHIQVSPNTSILQACEIAGIVIPRFCYHERLSVAGNCRMCLVEVEKMPKLQASCAVPVAPNMSIKTNTPSVKKAREGVLEFLLINHPLDCPICDQGGECDLQDQSLVYGGDRSRFKEFKRAVEDKNCGPLIKTIMTRCIHCTRCVRFANEVVGVPEFGTSGRGNFIEISTYIEKLFVSELSGNVIDLCPVGALTSKPYAFLSRPWELKSTESIDLFDSIHSNIRIDTRGYEIVRILPRLNESINEEWISDKARFSFDGLSAQRLLSPLLKTPKGNFEVIDWSKAISIVSEKMSNSKPNRIGFSVGDFCDLETLSNVHLLRSITNGVVLNHSNEDYLDTDNSTSFKFNTSLSNITKSDVCLLIGVDPKIDGVLLNYHLRKRFLSGNFKLGYIGSRLNLTFPSIHLGNSLDVFLSILEGKNLFCKSIKKSKRPIIIFGKSFLKNLSGYNPNLFMDILKSNLESFSSWNSLNFFNTKSSDFCFNDLGLNKNRGFLPPSLDTLYLVEDSRPSLKSITSKFIIFQGHHGCLNAQNADLILPSTSFVEKTSIYANCEGRYQFSQSCTLPLGKSKHGSAILSALVALLIDPKEKLKLLGHSFLLPPYNFSLNKFVHSSLNFTIFKNSLVYINNSYILSSLFDNFYKTDVISQLSSNMSKSSKELLNRSPF
uniref:NADH dehydrogenase subunit 11 n=1 Tax=Cryptomonas pyrenoidifera TaxID=233184 RepID=UPI00226CE59E|nr:NADH dehydrogenase subunit 11 [Cryptomonas pyrenoidifera]UZP15117.1 NADH dehydrogenase subunit 11 [Cryptomonas pyrenoidifera]